MRCGLLKKNHFRLHFSCSSSDCDSTSLPADPSGDPSDQVVPGGGQVMSSKHSNFTIIMMIMSSILIVIVTLSNERSLSRTTTTGTTPGCGWGWRTLRGMTRRTPAARSQPRHSAARAPRPASRSPSQSPDTTQVRTTENYYVHFLKNIVLKSRWLSFNFLLTLNFAGWLDNDLKSSTAFLDDDTDDLGEWDHDYLAAPVLTSVYLPRIRSIPRNSERFSRSS